MNKKENLQGSIQESIEMHFSITTSASISASKSFKNKANDLMNRGNFSW